MDGIHKDFCKNTRGYARVVDFMDEVLRRNHLKTLCILVENSRYPGFSKKLLDKLSGSMDIIDLKVGSGDRRSAEDYLYELLKSTGYEVDPDEPKKLLPDKMVYTVDEIYEIHDDWVKTGLKNRVYKSYRNCTFIDTKKTDGTPRAYETLQKLVGLTEIKELVDRIIDTVKVRKIRDSMGMTGNAKALHMVFTGNPGTAKTTVARLIGQIFAEEKILSSGAFVECGRADLVGKYVGWTAKNVRERFKDAKGGVLFIDEAYALADGTNTFGDEAINTLVQEMENHRSDVVVILAGYPDKMKTLLDRNEGLRSRITFLSCQARNH
jgi:SpoVK/Ycf46/Vps4 family AAA+-type ATPase